MAARASVNQQHANLSPDTELAIEGEIENLLTLPLDDVRKRWKMVFQREAPKSLSRDLLIRKLSWHLQEQAFGGHDRATLKVLANHAKGTPNAPVARRLKPGTEIVREYQGERHTVVITSGGFRWRDEAYRSLTAIARAITGANWNGPRFFGLRESSPGQGGRGRGLVGTIKGSGTKTTGDCAR